MGFTKTRILIDFGVKDDGRSRNNDRSRDLGRRVTYDDYGGDDTKSKKEKDRNPYRHKGYEKPKDTFKDAGADVVEEVLDQVG